MRKLILGAILLFSMNSFSSTNLVEVCKIETKHNVYTTRITSYQKYKKPRKERSDKGKKRGTYKKRK
jgi:hypothetical protein